MTPLIFLNECVSTNDEIVGYFTLNKNEITAVYTFNQIRGRGQYGNSWNMPADQNLAFSLGIQKDQINLSDILFNYHTALIFRDFFANLTNENVQVKWPNDLIIKKKKIAGILIESKKIQNAGVFIIGIGVNVLQTNFENLPKAGSLLTQTGQNIDLHLLAEKLFSHLADCIRGHNCADKLIQNFNRFLFRRNEVSVFEIKGLRQNGIIKNVDEDGFLWVELESDGLQKFYHKEIELLY